MHFTSKTLAATATLMITSLELVHAVSCPGVVQSDENSNDSYCCVGGDMDMDFGGDCDGWPMCTGTTTINTATSTISCATTIPVTASNYDDLVESASSKYLDSNSNSQGVTLTANIPGKTATRLTVSATGSDINIIGASATDQVATGGSNGSPGQSFTTSVTTATDNDSGSGKLRLGFAMAYAVMGGIALL